jgi:hypothetical protein
MPLTERELIEKAIGLIKFLLVTMKHTKTVKEEIGKVLE